MPLLRVKIILNEGGEGVPLSQLTDVAEEAEKFLRYLAEDSGIPVRRGEWLARNFDNAASVRFDVEKETYISVDDVKEFNRLFEHVDRVKTDRKSLNGTVRHRTIAQYAKVAKGLGPHEKVTFGLYRVDEENPYREMPLSKREAELLTDFIASEVTYRGSIHGMIHDIQLEELFFHLRRSGAQDLVKCEFHEGIYQDVVDGLERRHARVYVHGLMTVRRVDRAVVRMRVEKIKVAPTLTDERFRDFFGADPDYTGGVESDDFIEQNRYEQ
jgi:hypothetical protein